MTLVIALQGEKSAWLCADRRLTYSNRTRDDACKMLTVDATDGVALLGYAGLGATAIADTQPSDWMNDLLINHHGLSVEDYLGLIAEGMRADLPVHLATMPGAQAHHLLASAIVNGEARLYGVILEMGQRTMPPRFVYTRYARTQDGGPPPRLCIAGSGALHIPSPQKLSRELSKVVKAFEAGRVKPTAVADRLARVNDLVAGKDALVSQQCIVTWRFNGGGYQFYDGLKRVRADLTIPTVANGMDVRDILGISIPLMLKDFEAMRKGEPVKDHGKERQAAIDKVNARPKRKL